MYFLNVSLSTLNKLFYWDEYRMKVRDLASDEVLYSGMITRRLAKKGVCNVIGS